MLGKTYTNKQSGMKMKIKDVDKVCVVDIDGIAISKTDLIELKRVFRQKAEQKRIGINLKKVLNVNHDFLEFLQDTSSKQRLSLFNVNNEVYLLLFVSHNDEHVNIYLNEEDFYADKRRIVYRRLKLLKSA